MTTKSIIWIVQVIGFLAFQTAGQEKAPHSTLPADPEKAWEEVEKAYEVLGRPAALGMRNPTPEQVREFQTMIRASANSFANKAREFIQQFPTNENIGDARCIVVYALNRAVAAGDSDAEKQIGAFVSTVLADKGIPENGRVDVLLYSATTPVMKKLGMRIFREGEFTFSEEFETADIETMRVALKAFPTNTMVFNRFVHYAHRAKAERKKELVAEVLKAPKAPPEVKALANHVLNGTKPYQVGKPLDIRFTALDGREVDLSKLTGKVVLVQFWATDCGPCVGEIPAIKAAYEKFHARGFEVVGISLDEKESALRRFIKEKEMPWPQHFDGKVWENRFALQYGIFSIPRLWLVNKEGNLVSTDVSLGPFNYVEVNGKQVCVTSKSKELERVIAEQLDAKDSPGR